MLYVWITDDLSKTEGGYDVFMYIFRIILGFLAVSIGVFATLIGVSNGAIPTVVGGGLFMVLGVSSFVFNK